MSSQDEFRDLERRLRRSKPQTEPLPPVLKRQMRQELMEQITMNENRFSFGKLGMALGGLVILIGIPLLFWLAQMSIGTGFEPGTGGPTNETAQLDPARPTRDQAPSLLDGAAEDFLAADRAWVISADRPQGTTVGRYDTIYVTIGYKLVTRQEAELILKLGDQSRGFLTDEKIVSGPDGEVVIPLSMAELEDVSGDSITLQLSLSLRDLTFGAEKLLFLEFAEGWTIDLTAEPGQATAEIIQIGEPTLVETNGIVNESVYAIDLTTIYTLSGYDSAVLVVGYEYFDAAGGQTSGFERQVIHAGSGETPVTIWISRNFFDAGGETIEGFNFFARINVYDELSGEWVNLYPGNVDLSEIERLPLPLSGQSETSEDEIQLLGYEVVTRTTTSGVAADVTLFVGYNFSSDYSGSPLSFSFTSEYVTSNTGAGGGGGGGTLHSISPGLGTTEFTFSFETSSWERLQDWLESVAIQIDCCTTAGGEQVMIGQIYKVGFVSSE